MRGLLSVNDSGNCGVIQMISAPPVPDTPVDCSAIHLCKEIIFNF